MTFKRIRVHCREADAMASVGLMCVQIDVLSGRMASNRRFFGSHPKYNSFGLLVAASCSNIDLHLLAVTWPTSAGRELSSCYRLDHGSWLLRDTLLGCSFIHLFILETYIAPLQDTITQRRSQPSHGQRRRTWGRCKICKGRSSANLRNAAQQGDHSSRPMGPPPKRPFAA